MLVQSTCAREVIVGDVLKDRNGPHIYIVLKTGRNSRWTHLIDIESEAKSASCRRALPFKTKTDDLLLRLSTNLWSVSQGQKISGNCRRSHQVIGLEHHRGTIDVRFATRRPRTAP
jgi:hypothetical protein